jgi:hypothetical protein
MVSDVGPSRVKRERSVERARSEEDEDDDDDDDEGEDEDGMA